MSELRDIPQDEFQQLVDTQVSQRHFGEKTKEDLTSLDSRQKAAMLGFVQTYQKFNQESEVASIKNFFVGTPYYYSVNGLRNLTTKIELDSSTTFAGAYLTLSVLADRFNQSTETGDIQALAKQIIDLNNFTNDIFDRIKDQLVSPVNEDMFLAKEFLLKDYDILWKQTASDLRRKLRGQK